MKYKAICTDIDGTFLNADRQLSARTIAAVKQLGKEVPFILASSRMPSAMRHLQQQLGILHHPLICYNGGYVLHYSQSTEQPEVLGDVQIPLSVCSAVVQLAKGTSVHVSLYQADHWYAPQEDQWTQREIKNTKVTPTILESDKVLQAWHKSESGAHKIMCMGQEEEIKELAEKLEEEFGEQMYIYKSKSTYLELAPRSISKATALATLLQERFAISMSEAVAFGDNYNDIDMLQAVGLGIAVGSARPEVLAVADEVTTANIEDGVAVSIEKYFH